MNDTYRHVNEIDNTQERGILMEIARVLCCVLQYGYMPEEYIDDQEDESSESESSFTNEEPNLPEDEYEDTFNGDTLIERIKNCGDIYGDAKAFPIIVRNGSQEMQIIDTSIENNVLYIDVKDIIKKASSESRTRSDLRAMIEQMESEVPSDLNLAINPVGFNDSYIMFYDSLNSNINTAYTGTVTAASTVF